MINTIKKSLFLILGIIFALSILFCYPVISYASEDLGNISTDGMYVAPFEPENWNKMGDKAFENGKKQVNIEKDKNNYYMTVSIDSSVAKDLTLSLGTDKVGEQVVNDANIVRHTYTISKDNLTKKLNFSIFVKQMNRTTNFTLKPLVEQAVKTGEITNKNERPAEFVPVINVNASNAEFEKGSLFVVPIATAKFDGKEIPVIVKAYYKTSSNKKDIDIINGNLKLSEVGEYHIVYRAESDKYKTNLGNNTFTEIDVMITSKIGATTLAKIKNVEGKNVISNNASVQASYVNKDTNVYKLAADKMSKIADNFEVINVVIYDDNKQISLNDSILLSLKANLKYDKREIEVYHLADDGTITKLQTENYGRYVQCITNKTGNFIVCEPGVAFVMPMYGYALITVFGVILVVVAIVVLIVVIKKKKKKEMIANGTYIEKSKKRENK